MKKLLLMLAVALPLGACDSGPNVTADPHMKSEPYGIIVESAISDRAWSKIGIWTDPKTGCQYFTGEVHGGIMMTPRMSKGVTVCDDAKSTDYETYQRLKKQYEGK